MTRSSRTTATVALFLGAAMFGASAHEGEHFSAGEPGNPKRPARVIQVTMRDDDGKMQFVPDRVDVKKGEQVHFIIQNKGVLKHEFTLASVQDNNKHAELMQKYPDMEQASTESFFFIIRILVLSDCFISRRPCRACPLRGGRGSGRQIQILPPW